VNIGDERPMLSAKFDPCLLYRERPVEKEIIEWEKYLLKGLLIEDQRMTEKIAQHSLFIAVTVW
jgi:hypothetical protein